MQPFQHQGQTSKKLSVTATQIQQCNNLEIILFAVKRINSASYIAEALAACPSTTLGCTMHEPLQAQRPFYSTEKKRQLFTIKLAKTTEEEKEKIGKASLANKNMYALFEDIISHPVPKTIMHKSF